MQASFRFGDEESADLYPLRVSTARIWTVSGGKVAASIPVPPCPRQHILVPSVSVPGLQAGFQCALEVDSDRWSLQPVAARPAKEGAGPTRKASKTTSVERTGGDPVSTHIDCFHTERDLPESRLQVRLACREPPRRYLVTVTLRPLLIDPQAPAQTHVMLKQPPAISQMRGPPAIGKRICSPTALAMALQAARPGIDWMSVVEACHDGRFYGSWPLAIQCAGRHGRLGAVEAVTSWRPVLEVLRAGSPVVASIRFGRGELPGAPLPETGGHLVTVYGIDGEEVFVCDPAAPDHDSVPRRYELGAFSAAWMRHRGAAYFLAPS
ncbi:MAG: C39 family peptidase [Gammaproteobacteria bacterium]|nr:C39 family peptidase [Gammaproteobacteria bacterium]